MSKLMPTALKLELNETQRAELHLRLTGKKGLATRKMIVEWAQAELRATLDMKPVRYKLEPIACPRCNHAVSIKVPIYERHGALPVGQSAPEAAATPPPKQVPDNAIQESMKLVAQGASLLLKAAKQIGVE